MQLVIKDLNDPIGMDPPPPPLAWDLNGARVGRSVRGVKPRGWRRWFKGVLRIVMLQGVDSISTYQ